MDEREAFELSCQVEPLSYQTNPNSGAGSGKESRFRRRITPSLNQHRKNDSIASTVSGSSNSICDTTDGSLREESGGPGEEDDDEAASGGAASRRGSKAPLQPSLNDSVRSRVSSASASSACSTAPSLDASSLNGTPAKCDRASGGKSTPGGSVAGDSTPGGAGQLAPTSDPYRTPDFYIIRVSLESSSEATEGRFK